MKVIIAGPRDREADFYAINTAYIESGFDITELVCGMASGIDSCAHSWATNYSKIPIMEFPAKWKQLGRSAGPLRNIQMAEYADALIALWDGESRGTGHMIKTAKKRGLEVFVKYI